MLNALDVVIPSRSGASLIEAMALGRPVVASAAGGVLGARPRALCAMSHRPADGRQIEGGERVLIPALCGNVPAASATC